MLYFANEGLYYLKIQKLFFILSFNVLYLDNINI